MCKNTHHAQDLLISRICDLFLDFHAHVEFSHIESNPTSVIQPAFVASIYACTIGMVQLARFPHLLWPGIVVYYSCQIQKLNVWLCALEPGSETNGRGGGKVVVEA